MRETLNDRDVYIENYLPVKRAIQESQIINWSRQNPRLSTTDNVDLWQEFKTQTVKFPLTKNINTAKKNNISLDSPFL